MRSLTFLLSFLLLIASADAYTLILASGRRLTGDLISEAGGTIQFRDGATGVKLSFKRDQIDAEATAAANRPQPAPPQSATPAARDAAETRSLAQLAVELRDQRTGRSRVYTAADLVHAPQVSVSGKPGEDIPAEGKGSDSLDARDEKRWRSEARTMRKDLESAQDRATAAESACNKARDRNRSALSSSHRRPLDLAPLTEEPAECARWKEMNERLLHARSRLEEFEERARRAGVPWQWLE